MKALPLQATIGNAKGWFGLYIARIKVFRAWETATMQIM